MKIGVTALTETLKRVSRAASPAPKRKLEQGRISLHVKAEATVRFIFSIEDKSLYLMAMSEGMFAYDRITVELEDRDEEDFTFYLFPFHVLDLLSNADGTVSLYEDKRGGVKFLINEKQRFYLSSQYDVSDYFDTYPKAMKKPEGEPIKINAMKLIDAFNFTDYIPSGQRIADKVVVIKDIDDTLCIGSTDGFRVATYSDLAKVDMPVTIAIYRQYVSTLRQMIETEDLPIKIYFTDRAIYVNDLDFWAWALTVEDSHPIWELLESLPERNFLKFNVNIDLLSKALNVSSNFCEDGRGYVRLDFSDGEAVLSAESQQAGDTKWMFLEATENKQKYSVGFQPHFVLEYLSHAKPKELTMNFPENHEKAFSLQSENDIEEFIVMPIRIG